MGQESTRVLQDVGQRDPRASEQLLPLVYDELRKLAAAKMALERSGQTLQATALVHEAYLRLVNGNAPQQWNTRGHFFAAAGEAMRRILVERARHKQRLKHGGKLRRVALNDLMPADESDPDLILSVSEALERLAAEDEHLAELVKLRCFAGFSLCEAADVLDLSRSTAERSWAYAKSRLRCLMNHG